VQQITSVGDLPGEGDGNPLEISCSPNPFRQSVEISFKVPKAGPVEICVFDVSGRLVRRFELNAASPGRRSLHWYGDDQDSRKLPAGIYAYSVTTGGISSVGKIVMAR
jgi:flagellar hook assembly protein FlgD